MQPARKIESSSILLNQQSRPVRSIIVILDSLQDRYRHVTRMQLVSTLIEYIIILISLCDDVIFKMHSPAVDHNIWNKSDNESCGYYPLKTS